MYAFTGMEIGGFTVTLTGAAHLHRANQSDPAAVDGWFSGFRV